MRFPAIRALTAAGLLAISMQPHPARAQSSAITLTPAIVEAGSPELIRVDAPATAHLEGEWLGRKLQFFRGRDGLAWYALAGADVEATPGPSTLKVAVSGGRSAALNRQVEIHPAHYKTGSLTVPPKYVEPDAEAQKQIKADSELKARVFAASAGEPLWAGDFRAPVTAAPTDSFGTRRMFNGKLIALF
jgi:hypothetical protein